MMNTPSVSELGSISESILSTGMVKHLLKSVSCFCNNKPVPCSSHHKIKGVRDQAVDHLHRLRRHTRRPVTDLESHGKQRAGVQTAGSGHRIRKDGEATREEPHVRRVSAVVHHLVHRSHVDRCVDHHRIAGGVDARLLNDQLLCRLQNN